MARKYKLTDQSMRTYNGFQWELGKEYSTSGEGDLCNTGWLHCYSHPLLAVLLNPIHASISNPRLFICNATGNHKYDKGLKEGSTTMELVKEIPLPLITCTQKVAFAILCSLTRKQPKEYTAWANNWLNNVDRSQKAADAAADADAYADATYATYAANVAAYADAAYATYAAYAAAHAAAHANINFIDLAKKALTY
jgi:hypothetical protein